MNHRKAGLFTLVNVIVLVGVAVPAELPADFDGNSSAVIGTLAGARQEPAPAAIKTGSDVKNPGLPDVNWLDDKAAFESAKIDHRAYPASASVPGITIDPVLFQQKLEEFAGAKDTVINGQTVRIAERGSAQGRDLARQWLAQEYQRIGFQTSVQNFGQGANFIAIKPGTSGKTIILSAHMDSVNNAGADDDGSGDVAALLIASALKGMQFNNTLEVVGFDLEELGLVGSHAFVQNLPSGIIADVHMDMVSYNGKKDGHFHVIDCNRPDSRFLTNDIMGTIQSMGLPLVRVAACTQSSDHSSFWSKGVPAVVVSENFFGGDHDPCYHQQCDVVDQRLDFQYAARIATALANTLPGLLNAAPASGGSTTARAF